MHGRAAQSCAFNAGAVAAGFRIGVARHALVSTAYDAGPHHGVPVT
ncbi:hypothetical protein [Pseudarthrobacter equi]|nr:hypothetical protein [Pseudarthrobacter equi]